MLLQEFASLWFLARGPALPYSRITTNCEVSSHFLTYLRADLCCCRSPLRWRSPGLGRPWRRRLRWHLLAVMPPQDAHCLSTQPRSCRELATTLPYFFSGGGDARGYRLYCISATVLSAGLIAGGARVTAVVGGRCTLGNNLLPRIDLIATVLVCGDGGTYTRR